MAVVCVPAEEKRPPRTGRSRGRLVSRRGFFLRACCRRSGLRVLRWARGRRSGRPHTGRCGRRSGWLRR
eukprot:3428288-Lingulodinium_polyedra.AAC.1